jgi:hypothetical protein
MGAKGIRSAPVLLDRCGNGLDVDTVSTSSYFVDFDGDGYLHRTSGCQGGLVALVRDRVKARDPLRQPIEIKRSFWRMSDVQPQAGS